MAYIDSNMDAADAVADAMTEFMKTDAGKDLLELHADVANAKRAHNYEDSDSYTGDYNVSSINDFAILCCDIRSIDHTNFCFCKPRDL